MALCFAHDHGRGSGSSNTFTDSRDGKRYRTVKMGDKTWMAENLNFKTDNSWCYGGDKNNCREYGRLYDWNAAMKACPAGWRLPSREDWNDLIKVAGSGAVAAKKLRSEDGWKNRPGVENNGTDEFGFSALPGGRRNDYGSGSFSGVGGQGYWWSAAESGNNRAYLRTYYYQNTSFGEMIDSKNESFSVRCVK